MKRLIALIALLGIALFATVQHARATEDDYLEPPEGAVLCPPGDYHEIAPPRGCEPLGPSIYLTRMGAMGITFPMLPPPVRAPDSALAQSQFSYGRVNYIKNKPAPIFISLENAIANKPVNRYLEPGFAYVSYINVVNVDGRNYYQIGSGEWMRGAWLSSNVAVSRFQGVEVYGTPKRPFGWILYPLETKSTPGYSGGDYTGKYLTKYDLVQIYHVERVDDMDWYLIGPDEWIVQTKLGIVFPNTTPPEDVTNGRWIEVNLYEQTVAVYDNHRLVFATLMSSGANPWFTRPGVFQIYQKFDATPMRGAFAEDRSDYYYLEDVPWTMYFDNSIALHGAYWHNGFGYPRSHGCVNLSVGDAQWLFNWAQEGDWVYVHDPSGQTPTQGGGGGP